MTRIPTRIWREMNHECEQQLQEAASLLKQGGTVAFPTETVYGLGADARNDEAVKRIFQAKGRPSDNPLIVHIAHKQQLNELVMPYPALAEALMDRFWPGPLTIVLPMRMHTFSPLVTAGLQTVGIRVPNHPIALRLLELANCPVAAPSANRSGRPSPTRAEHVLEDLDGLIDGIVDSGACGVGIESTVVELEDEQTIRILRPGGVSRAAIREAFPQVRMLSSDQEATSLQIPRSPGMKYTHYAPKGQLTIVQGEATSVHAYIQQQVIESKKDNLRSGVLAFSERMQKYEADIVFDCGSERQLDQAAHRLYAALRECDSAHIDRIWAEACDPEGAGEALMNRMIKASGGSVLQV